MIPTILVGDYVLIWKAAYHWKLPFSEYATDPIILKLKEGPQRGEVIVFRYPRDQTLFYIKRVIGVSGDWVVIKNRKLFINDHPVSTAELGSDQAAKVLKRIQGGDSSFQDFLLMEETIDEKKHLILHDRNQFVSERYGPIAVPPGHVFVMGDNRDFSNDSRFWGFVPLSLIEGRAFLVWMQLNLNWDPFGFQWSLRRMGQKL